MMSTSTRALPPDPCRQPVVWHLSTLYHVVIYSAVRVLSQSPLCGGDKWVKIISVLKVIYKLKLHRMGRFEHLAINDCG